MLTEPTGTELAVCNDIARRQAHGIAKYGTTVADNPLSLKQWLQHAYEETLDKAVYLKRAIAEIDKMESDAQDREWERKNEEERQSLKDDPHGRSI